MSFIQRRLQIRTSSSGALDDWGVDRSQTFQLRVAHERKQALRNVCLSGTYLTMPRTHRSRNVLGGLPRRAVARQQVKIGGSCMTSRNRRVYVSQSPPGQFQPVRIKTLHMASPLGRALT